MSASERSERIFSATTHESLSVTAGDATASLRADLAAVLIDREEQARLDSLLDVEHARVRDEFPGLMS